MVNTFRKAKFNQVMILEFLTTICAKCNNSCGKVTAYCSNNLLKTSKGLELLSYAENKLEARVIILKGHIVANTTKRGSLHGTAEIRMKFKARS